MARKRFDSPPLPPGSPEEMQERVSNLQIRAPGLMHLVFAIAGEEPSKSSESRFRRPLNGKTSNTTFSYALVRLLTGDERIANELPLPAEIREALTRSAYGDKAEMIARFAAVLDAVQGDDELMARAGTKLQIMEDELAARARQREEDDES